MKVFSFLKKSKSKITKKKSSEAAQVSLKTTKTRDLSCHSTSSNASSTTHGNGNDNDADLDLYQRLSQDPAVCSFELMRVDCYRKRNMIVGLQAIYTVYYENGQVQQVATDCPCANKKGAFQCSRLELEVGEYLVDIQATTHKSNTGAIKALTFITQTGRVVTLGQSTAQSDQATNDSPPRRRKVVALATRHNSKKTALTQVVFYTEPEPPQDTTQPRPHMPRFTLQDRSNHHKLDKHCPIAHAQQVLHQPTSSRSSSSATPFCDLAFYQYLLQQPNVTKVQLSKIQCYYRPNHSILGVFGVYQSMFQNGAVVQDQQSMDHAQHAPPLWKKQQPEGIQLDTLTLQPDDFAVDIQVRQQKGVLTVITNRRTVFLGSSSNSDKNVWHDNNTNNQHSSSWCYPHRIVALAGIRRAHQLARISIVTESRQWELVGPLVTTRELVQQGRAEPTAVVAVDDGDHDDDVQEYSEPTAAREQEPCHGSASSFWEKLMVPTISRTTTTTTNRRISKSLLQLPSSSQQQKRQQLQQEEEIQSKQKHSTQVLQGLMSSTDLPDDMFQEVISFLVPTH